MATARLSRRPARQRQRSVTSNKQKHLRSGLREARSNCARHLRDVCRIERYTDVHARSCRRQSFCRITFSDAIALRTDCRRPCHRTVNTNCVELYGSSAKLHQSSNVSFPSLIIYTRFIDRNMGLEVYSLLSIKRIDMFIWVVPSHTKFTA